MSILIEQEHGGAAEGVVVVAGAFDEDSVQALRAAMAAHPSGRGVIVDLSELDEVDQRAIGALLAAAHRLAEDGRSLEIRAAKPSVRKTLRSVGLHQWAAVA